MYMRGTKLQVSGDKVLEIIGASTAPKVEIYQAAFADITVPVSSG